MIAAQLQPAGIAVEITDVDFSTWLDMQGNGEFDAFMLSWIGNIDPDDFYYAQHHSEGGFNFQGYSNAEVDELLEAARVETDQAARKDALRSGGKTDRRRGLVHLPLQPGQYQRLA